MNSNLHFWQANFSQIEKYLDQTLLLTSLKIRKHQLQGRKYREFYQELNTFKARIIKENLLQFKGIYQFFEAQRTQGTREAQGLEVQSLAQEKIALGVFKGRSPLKNNTPFHGLLRLCLNAPPAGENGVKGDFVPFIFPRVNNICITDSINENEPDSIAFFVVTAGQETMANIDKFNQNFELVNSYYLTAFAIAGVEAAAEAIHAEIRKIWGILPKKGERFSFGYPLCPDLSYQAKLWQLLDVEKNLNVKLSENFMMQPEISISALVLPRFKK